MLLLLLAGLLQTTGGGSEDRRKESKRTWNETVRGARCSISSALQEERWNGNNARG
jgi:hypothetical protein